VVVCAYILVCAHWFCKAVGWDPSRDIFFLAFIRLPTGHGDTSPEKRFSVQGSKSVQKRTKESAQEEAATKAAAVMRKERRSFGHVPVLPRGQDPARDATEKGYVTIATKCVPLLLIQNFGNVRVHRISCPSCQK
jgi:hypothetical protein